MGALIDASVLIAAERGTLDLDPILDDFREEDLALAAITASELLHGVHRSDNEARRSKREAFVETLLSHIPVIAFDLVAARAHSRVLAQLAAAGEPIGAHDLLIAATAISRGMDVVSRDERSFSRIPGLSVILW